MNFIRVDDILINLDDVLCVIPKQGIHKVILRDQERYIPLNNEQFEELSSQLIKKKRKAKQINPEAEEVLTFLNEKTGRTFKPVPANLETITARLNEGATVQEMRQVIAIKVRSWKDDDKMRGYLRPSTLFGREKYAQYSGELNRIGNSFDQGNAKGSFERVANKTLEAITKQQNLRDRGEG